MLIRFISFQSANGHSSGESQLPQVHSCSDSFSEMVVDSLGMMCYDSDMANDPRPEDAVEEKSCPACGNTRPPSDAHEYECTRCGIVGFDCCVPGRATLCWDCDNDGVMKVP